MDDTLAVGAAIEVFNLKGLQEFTADKRVRKALVKGGQIDVEMACYEPGQSTVVHQHPRQDEIFYVVEGRVNMCIGGNEHVFDAGAMVHVHRGTTHDVRNTGPARASIIFFKLAIGLLGAIKS